MRHYIVKIIFRVLREDDPAPTEFDAQFRYFSADDDAGAFSRAEAIGKMEESVLSTRSRKKIRWEFIGIDTLCAADVLKDGETLFTQTVVACDANRYIADVRERTEYLRMRSKQLTFPLMQN